jgi:hypothetical protein
LSDPVEGNPETLLYRPLSTSHDPYPHAYLERRRGPSVSDESSMPRYWPTTKREQSENACFAVELVASNTFERGSCSLDTCPRHP